MGGMTSPADYQDELSSLWGLNGPNDPYFNQIDEIKTDAPLKSLRPSTVQQLSTLLNPTKLIPTEDGLLRDWRGLAELAGIMTEQIVFLESKEDPTKELLKIWMSATNRNLSDLKACLGVIDRFDICDDISPSLESDSAFYWANKDKIALPLDAAKLNGAEELSANDSHVLTVDDADGIFITRYDAFILYAEEDSEFAMQIVDKMENEYNLKICVKDRDLLGGSRFEHEVISRIIEERCNRLLAIFSPNFLKSQANQFFVSYAQALALELRQRKIIPCMYIRCELPPSVRYSFCLDYNRSGKLWNFWDKLSQSIKTTSIIAVPDKKSAQAYHNQSNSLPASNSIPMSLPDSISWWDSQKSRQHSSYSTSDSGIHDPSEDFGNLSLQSASPFLSSSSLKSKLSPPSPAATKGSNSKTKWLKNLMTPVKKKKHKDSRKGQAEQLLI